MNNKKKIANKKSIIAIIIFVVSSIIIFITSAYMFYHQATRVSDDLYYSDLRAQIFSATHILSQCYSLGSYIFSFLYKLAGNQVILIVVYLSIMIVLTMVAVYCLFNNFDKLDGIKKNRLGNLLLSIATLMPMSICVPFLDLHIYSYYSGNIWHNSTYFGMRLLGIMVLIAYLNIQKNYLNNISFKQWIIFCFLLVLVNAYKPNFILGFAPAMLVFLIIDFLRDKNYKDKNKVKQIIKFGVPVLISLVPLIFMQKILYGSTAVSEISTQSGITLTLENLSIIYTPLKIGLGIAFPAWILLWNVKKLKTSHWYAFSWVMEIVNILIYLFIKETGPRETAQNFGWGSIGATYILFATSIAAFTQSIFANKNATNISKAKKTIYLSVGILLFLLHAACGIYYYIQMLYGHTYIL